MNNRNEQLETLQEIRSLMERSSRFISLSGLSGVAAGIFALIGAGFVYVYLDTLPFEHKRLYYITAQTANKWGMNYIQFFLLDAIAVLAGAISMGIFFTTRRARRKGQTIWDSTAQRLLINLAIPLVSGGVFCLALLYHGQIGLIAPATLIFYGLSLVNASKYTLSDIRYLGFLEIILGSAAMFSPGYGLEIWAIGFGILHIVYGIIMYYKYD
ncbi:MAG: hypothetical protein AAFV95_05280 [Bacteroidota bacterium]